MLVMVMVLMVTAQGVSCVSGGGDGGGAVGSVDVSGGEDVGSDVDEYVIKGGDKDVDGGDDGDDTVIDDVKCL